MIFLIALAIWVIRPSWLMPFWLISIPVLAPILVFRSGIQNTDELLNFIFGIWGAFQRVFIVIVVYQLIVKKRNIPKEARVFMIPCVFLCVYFIFHNVVRHFNLTSLYRDVAGACYYFLPILVMILDKEVRPKLKDILGILIFIIAIQIIMVPLNLEGVIVYTMRYQDRFFLQEELGLVSGTFSRSNALADFLSIAYLFICVDFFTRKGISKTLFYTMSVVILSLLLLTGSKMPIVCSLLVYMLCLFYYKRKMLFHLTGAFIGLVLIIVFSWSHIEKLGEEYQGIDRFVSGITNFIESKKGKESDDSTIRLSTALINTYYWRNPIIGCAYSYKGEENAYPTNLNVDFGLSNYNADATLALHLVEYGAIGLLLYLYYYYSLIKYSVSVAFKRKQIKTVITIIFTFLLVFSVTEGGLFYRPNFFYFYTYIFAIQRHREETFLV